MNRWIAVGAFVLIVVIGVAAERAHYEDQTDRNCRIEVRSSGSTLPEYRCDYPSERRP